VNRYTPDNQTNADLAMDGHGNFVAVWRGDGSSGDDDSASSVQGQRDGTVLTVPSLSPGLAALCALLLLGVACATRARGARD